MNCLHTYGAKLDCKDHKVSLRDKKRPDIGLYERREEKPYHLRSAMKASIECLSYADHIQYIHIHICSL